MAKLSPLFNEAQFINGIPANGAKVFTYVAGSSTKQSTYTDEAGLVAQANPIILNSRGEPNSPIWLTEGLSYKFVFAPSTDIDPPTSPIRTLDNIEGVNDSSTTVDQWVQSGFTPTFVSATQFTVPGDQTSAFHVNRRVKALVTAGTVYGYISASVFGALTTVTVVLDSGVLDSGLSNVQLGLITSENTSIRVVTTQIGDLNVTNAKLANSYINDLTAVTFDYGADSVAVADGSDSGNKKKSFLSASKIQPITSSVVANALTITINPTTLDFRDATLGSGAVNTRTISSPINTVISSGSTGGTVNGVQSRIAVLAIDSAGTIEVAWTNVSGGTNLDETGVISTTAEGGAGAADSATVIYSTTARTNVPYRVVGFVESTQATAGTWATPPSKIQGYGGQAFAAMCSLGHGQTWQQVTGSRALGTTYYNTTGKPIAVHVTNTTPASNSIINATVNGVVVGYSNQSSALNICIFLNFIVPAYQSYSANIQAGTPSITIWSELR